MIGTRISSRIPRVVALALGPLTWVASSLPQIRVGLGAPTEDAPDGTLYLRADPASASSVIYARVLGAWVSPGGISSAAIDALAALTPAADKLPFFTSASAAALTTLTSFARTLLDDADAAAARTTLGAQASNANLTAIAGQTFAADQVTYQTGAGAVANTSLTSFGRSLIDDANAAAGRTTLEVTSTADLASTANAKGASLIGVEDSGGLLTATTVEAALAEILRRIPITAILTADLPIGTATFVTIMTTPRPLAASTRYFVTGLIGYTSTATRDAFLGILLPTGATIEGSISHATDGIQTATGAVVTGVSAGTTVGATPTGGTNCIELTAATAIRWARFWFYLTTDQAGTLAILGAGKDSGSLVYADGTCLVCQPMEAGV